MFRLRIDYPLVGMLFLLAALGLIILYSASSANLAVISRQGMRFLLATSVMLVLAQIPPHRYYQWAPYLFGVGVVLLITVLVVGHIGKGAQRWLNFGLFRFQPSELMKVASPMMLAWYLDKKVLPPDFKTTLTCCVLLIVPTLLVAKQPDLGTAIIIASASLWVLFLAGLSWRFIIACVTLGGVMSPLFWHFLHDFQKKRILTFLQPERDPLGSGYHIIQSKIAIGSGGIIGKGWLNGTQSHLQFLPEHSTDFIFAVFGEEFGFIGSLILLALLLAIVARCLYISVRAQSTFTRLLAGSLSLTFFLSFFVNIGMVTGILPVVGIPLPLVSYGGTSMVTMMASFGMLMSIHTHRQLITK